MKTMILLAVSLVLLSCSGDRGNNNDTSSTDTGNNAAIKVECDDNAVSTATQNSIQLTINNAANNMPLSGVVVQVDHSGKCIFSDANGHVNFDNLSTGPHDIHIFGQKGYGWKSFYDLEVSNIAVLNLPTISIQNPADTLITVSQPYVAKSVLVYTGLINFNDPVATTDPNNLISFEYFSDNAFSVVTELATDAGSKYYLEYGFEVTPDVVINDEYVVFKTSVDGTTKDEQLIDAIKVSPVGAIRSSSNAIKIINSQDIAFSLAARIKTNLMKFNTVLFPAELTLTSLRLNGQFLTNNVATGNNRHFRSVQLFQTSQNANFDITQALSAYSPPILNMTNLRIFLIAKNNSGSNWFYNTSVLYSDALNSALPGQPGLVLIPKLTTIPTLVTPIQNTIKWNSVADIVLQENNLEILQGSGATQKTWDITMSGISNNLTLPALPIGLVRFLVKGESYTLNLFGVYRYQSTIGTGNAFEGYSNQITWIY